MVNDAPGDLALNPINGPPATLQEWLTTFHLVVACLDPFTPESAWLLPTVGRILRVYNGADCRVSLLVTCTPEEARQYLGPYAVEFLTFTDPDRTTVKALDIERLPALVHLRQDQSVAGWAEGWQPAEWRAVTHYLSKAMDWTRPTIPAQRDPAPYLGSPAQG